MEQRHTNPVELLKSSKEWNFIKDKFLEEDVDLDCLDDDCIKEELFYGRFEDILDFTQLWLDDHCAAWAHETRDDCYGCNAATYVLRKDVVNLQKLSEILTEPDEDGYWLPLKIENGIYVYWCGMPRRDD